MSAQGTPATNKGAVSIETLSDILDAAVRVRSNDLFIQGLLASVRPQPPPQPQQPQQQPGGQTDAPVDSSETILLAAAAPFATFATRLAAIDHILSLPKGNPDDDFLQLSILFDAALPTKGGASSRKR